MALLYVDDNKAQLNRSEVTDGEVISEAEFIVEEDGGTVRRFDPANDPLPHGIVVHYAEGDSIAEHDEDYFQNYDDLWTYDGSEGDRLYWQPLDQVDRIKPLTITDNGTDPEPSIADGRVVGIINLNGETRIVEEGYTANDGTQYGDGGAGSFVSIGRVAKYPQNLRINDNYDERIPVRLDADEFTA